MSAERGIPQTVIREYNEAQAGERVGWISATPVSDIQICVQGIIAAVGPEGAKVTCEQYSDPDFEYHVPYGFRASGFTSALKLFARIDKERPHKTESGAGVAPMSGGIIAPDALVAMTEQEVIIENGFGTQVPTESPTDFLSVLRSTLQAFDVIDVYPRLYYQLNYQAATIVPQAAFFATKVSDWALPDPDMEEITAVDQTSLERAVNELDGIIAENMKMNTRINTSNTIDELWIPSAFISSREKVAARRQHVLQYAAAMVLPVIPPAEIGWQEYDHELIQLDNGNSEPATRLLQEEIERISQKTADARWKNAVLQALQGAEQQVVNAQ